MLNSTPQIVAAPFSLLATISVFTNGFTSLWNSITSAITGQYAPENPNQNDGITRQHPQEDINPNGAIKKSETDEEIANREALALWQFFGGHGNPHLIMNAADAIAEDENKNNALKAAAIKNDESNE